MCHSSATTRSKHNLLWLSAASCALQSLALTCGKQLDAQSTVVALDDTTGPNIVLYL
jgi:hypothetical protein